MSELSFTEYLKARRVTDTPAGDFVADAKADAKMPNAETWEQLESYLHSRSASQDAISAARTVWDAYATKKRSY